MKNIVYQITENHVINRGHGLEGYSESESIRQFDNFEEALKELKLFGSLSSYTDLVDKIGFHNKATYYSLYEMEYDYDDELLEIIDLKYYVFGEFND